MKTRILSTLIGLLSIMNLYSQSYSLNTPINQLKEAAENNNAEAQFWLGQAYFQGENVQKNETKGFQWVVLSANQGYTKAQTAVGECYLYGDGTTQNENKAIEWLKKAADKNDPIAAYDLGHHYLYTVDEPVEAYEYLRKAVEYKYEGFYIGQNGEEYNSAMFDYGACAATVAMLYGIIPEDCLSDPNATDAKCIFFAAKHGSLEAQYYVGRYYLESGKYNEAFKLIKQSAENDYPMAKYDLGVMYYQGKGVTKNTQTAIKWWKEAASDGIFEAKEALRKLNIRF